VTVSVVEYPLFCSRFLMAVVGSYAFTMEMELLIDFGRNSYVDRGFMTPPPHPLERGWWGQLVQGWGSKSARVGGGGPKKPI